MLNNRRSRSKSPAQNSRPPKTHRDRSPLGHEDNKLSDIPVPATVKSTPIGHSESRSSRQPALPSLSALGLEGNPHGTLAQVGPSSAPSSYATASFSQPGFKPADAHSGTGLYPPARTYSAPGRAGPPVSAPTLPLGQLLKNQTLHVKKNSSHAPDASIAPRTSRDSSPSGRDAPPMTGMIGPWAPTMAGMITWSEDPGKQYPFGLLKLQHELPPLQKPGLLHLERPATADMLGWSPRSTHAQVGPSDTSALLPHAAEAWTSTGQLHGRLSSRNVQPSLRELIQSSTGRELVHGVEEATRNPHARLTSIGSSAPSSHATAHRSQPGFELAHAHPGTGLGPPASTYSAPGRASQPVSAPTLPSGQPLKNHTLHSTGNSSHARNASIAPVIFRDLSPPGRDALPMTGVIACWATAVGGTIARYINRRERYPFAGDVPVLPEAKVRSMPLGTIMNSVVNFWLDDAGKSVSKIELRYTQGLIDHMYSEGKHGTILELVGGTSSHVTGPAYSFTTKVWNDREKGAGGDIDLCENSHVLFSIAGDGETVTYIKRHPEHPPAVVRGNFYEEGSVWGTAVLCYFNKQGSLRTAYASVRECQLYEGETKQGVREAIKRAQPVRFKLVWDPQRKKVLAQALCIDPSENLEGLP